MNTGFVVHTSQLSRTSISRHPIKDGSQVLVRIISDKGNGKYEGSVAGARVTINSKQPLQPGSTFTAIITSKDGKIQLFPNATNEAAQSLQNNGLSVLQNEQLAAFIKSAGLQADDISFHLLQQMKQLEMKLDQPLMSKLHNIAVRFKGKEKKAAELLMILAKKGLDYSEDELEALLAQVEWQETDDNSKSNQNDFALLNRINAQKENWQLLPYQIVSTEQTLADGCIRVLMGKDNSLKLVNVECNWLSSGAQYLFSLEYDKGHCTKIKINSGNKAIAQMLQNRLNAMGKYIPLELVDASLIEGTACGSQEFYVFGGDA